MKEKLRSYVTSKNLVLGGFTLLALAMGWFPTIVAVIVIIGLIAGAHEMGHLLAAKAVGVRVDEFSLGIGSTRLVARTWGDTEYSVRPIPLGAFVRPAGMDPGEEYEPENDPGERSYARKGLVAKLLILAGGSMANIGLTILIIAGLFWHHGDMPTSMLVNRVFEGPAAEAGIRAQDIIVAVDQEEITNYLRGIELIAARPDEEIILTVRRPIDPTVSPPSYEELMIPVVPRETPDGAARINIEVGPFAMLDEAVPLTAVEALQRGVDTTLEYVVRIYELTLGMFGRAFRRMEVPEQIGGPVKIVSTIKDAVMYDINVTDILQLTASLSVSIGVFNLLPIPALDGGRILILLLGWVLNLGYMVTRRRMPEKDLIPQQAEEMFHVLGFIFLILLVVIVSYKDVGDLVRARSADDRPEVSVQDGRSPSTEESPNGEDIPNLDEP